MPVAFPYFGGVKHEHFASTGHADILLRSVPVKKLQLPAGETLTATVFDLLAAHYGIDRGLGGADAASSYDDDLPYTPAWQERITGVKRGYVIATAREFAENAAKTKGRSMVILGAGVNHWYHADMTYRAIINMLVLCGCVGQSGGGWAHYVGQEKLRPQTGWTALAFALDWSRPPRQMNGTSFFYAHTDQWRYEKLGVEEILSPLADSADWQGALIDFNVRAERMGWLPSSPQLEANPLDISRQATAAGVEVKDFVVGALKAGRLRLACEDPDEPRNFPRNLFIWRSNLLGASSKGHEYFLKHLVGAQHGVQGKDLGAEGGLKPREVAWHEKAPEGKLDLMVTIDFRMSTSGMYSDIVLPTATWYEKHDLNTSDMHPFIHPLTKAVDPVWESRSDWEIFKGIARKFSELALGHLGVEQDVVLTPLLHDSPAELGQAMTVKDWKRGECEAVPGKTMPSITVVERDFPNTYKRFTALGPLMDQLGNGGKGIAWKTGEEVALLGELNGAVTEPGATLGRPRIETDIHAAETILALAPETNGHVAVKSWQALSVATGREHAHLGLPREDDKIRFNDLVAQPRKIISSPIWSGIESDKVSYTAGYTNVHELIPWRTLTGRQQLYQDHPWMRAFGEGFCSLPAADRHANRQRAHRQARQRQPGDRAELHHAAPEMGHPQHLHRQSDHADAVARRSDRVDQRDRRAEGRHRGQRLDRALQSQRRAHRARRRQPARQGGHVPHVPCPGEDRERARQRDHGPARRHPQFGHARGRQADPHDRRLRPAQLRLQLLWHGRLQSRRIRDLPEDEDGRLAEDAAACGPFAARRRGRVTRAGHGRISS